MNAHLGSASRTVCMSLASTPTSSCRDLGSVLIHGHCHLGKIRQRKSNLWWVPLASYGFARGTDIRPSEIRLILRRKVGFLGQAHPKR